MTTKAARLLLAFGLMMIGQTALAAETTSSIFGEIIDVATKKAVDGAIVLATSPALPGEQTEISDEHGHYRLTTLPPGAYTVSVTAPGFQPYSETVQLLVARQVKLKIELLPEVMEGEMIEMRAMKTGAIIDQGSTTTGATLTREYLDRLALGRTFDAVAEVAPGATSDDFGLSFNGASSPENAVFIDGASATDPAFGVLGSNLPIEFLEQIEVKTGGYMPEFGHASGGIINVITKLGGNEFHGSIFNHTTIPPLAARSVGQSGEALRVSRSLAARQELGFELGGPIVRDVLWFHVGFAPRLEWTRVSRQFHRRVDADGDGLPDTDMAGTPITERITELGEQRSWYQDHTYPFTAKLTWNVASDHRITAGFSGNPIRQWGIPPLTQWLAQTAGNGDDSAFRMQQTRGGYDGLVSYDGGFLGRKLLLNAVVGYHRQDEKSAPLDPSDDRVNLTVGPETDLAQFRPELAPHCGDFVDANGVRRPRCAVTNYQTGGVGFLRSARLERLSLRLNVTGFFDLIGRHQVKGGFEFQNPRYTRHSRYTGGAWMKVIELAPGFYGYLDQFRFAHRIDNDLPPTDDNLVFRDRTNRNATFAFNYSAYVQDSWTILDRINISGGVRVDYQDMHGGDGKTAFSLTNVAPRVGVLYDPTGVGKAKIFGSYGRFYELYPLHPVDQQFPTQTFLFGARLVGSPGTELEFAL